MNAGNLINNYPRIFFSLHVIAAMLCVWRLTDLITADRIMDSVRKAFPGYLLTCPRCMSVWSSIAATIAFIYYPFANWPFALAWLYLWHKEILMHQRGRQLMIEVDKSNNAHVVRSELNNDELRTIFINLLPQAKDPEVKPEAK